MKIHVNAQNEHHLSHYTMGITYHTTYLYPIFQNTSHQTSLDDKAEKEKVHSIVPTSFSRSMGPNAWGFITSPQKAVALQDIPIPQ